MARHLRSRRHDENACTGLKKLRLVCRQYMRRRHQAQDVDGVMDLDGEDVDGEDGSVGANSRSHDEM